MNFSAARKWLWLPVSLAVTAPFACAWMPRERVIGSFGIWPHMVVIAFYALLAGAAAFLALNQKRRLIPIIVAVLLLVISLKLPKVGRDPVTTVENHTGQSLVLLYEVPGGVQIETVVGPYETRRFRFQPETSKDSLEVRSGTNRLGWLFGVDLPRKILMVTEQNGLQTFNTDGGRTNAEPYSVNH